MSTDLIAAVLKLTNAVEQLTQSLGQPAEMRYTDPQKTNDFADEKSMSKMLGISPRTLADQRRKGKLPGCWIKNGRQIRWHVERTLAAWNEGIS